MAQMIELGIDSFAARFAEQTNNVIGDVDAIEQLLERIVHADISNLDVFGIGEHHRKGFLDSAPSVILSAAAARTNRIRLTSAVSVLSAEDPVRLFQQYATLDLISKGRAEMVVGRGSSVEAFPLFGYSLNDYDQLFEEKLNLLLQIRQNELVSWKGRFRAPINALPVYPRPLQNHLPIWLGVGGTASSFARAGALGLPLMVAIIGGLPERFKPLIDLYFEAGLQAGHKRSDLKVGVHMIGYLAETSERAVAEFYPGYLATMNKVGRERGWAPMTKEWFEAQLEPEGALLIGSASEVADKINRHSASLGGLSRLTFQMDAGELKHEQLLNAIELMGTRLKPLINNLMSR
jgi:probable LLM family oxidoreductase